MKNLADVLRARAAKGEDPEAATWLDHVFQPFWLKVPLEIAAIVLIVGLVMHGEHPAPTQPVGNRELANAADARSRLYFSTSLSKSACFATRSGSEWFRRRLC